MVYALYKGLVVQCVKARFYGVCLNAHLYSAMRGLNEEHLLKGTKMMFFSQQWQELSE